MISDRHWKISDRFLTKPSCVCTLRVHTRRDRRHNTQAVEKNTHTLTTHAHIRPVIHWTHTTPQAMWQTQPETTDTRNQTATPRRTNLTRTFCVCHASGLLACNCSPGLRLTKLQSGLVTDDVPFATAVAGAHSRLSPDSCHCNFLRTPHLELVRSRMW